MAEKNRMAGHGGGPGRQWSLGRLARWRPFIIGATIIGAGLILFVLVWFQPQKLFLNKTVNEPGPGITGTASGGEANGSAAAGRSSPPDLQVLRSGSFRSLEHATTGRAIVLRRPNGSLILRLERLSTSNGPDLRVYLSRVPAGSCTPTGPVSSTWARSRATKAARTMSSPRARTSRHSRARSSGAAGSSSDSVWPRCHPELSRTAAGRPTGATRRSGGSCEPCLPQGAWTGSRLCPPAPIASWPGVRPHHGSACHSWPVAAFGPVRRSPSFAQLSAAQTISPLGDAMATTALILHVQRATGSGTAVGLLLFAQAVPPLLAPFAGVIANRFRLGRLLMAGWLVQAALAALLALLLPPRGLRAQGCLTRTARV